MSEEPTNDTFRLNAEAVREALRTRSPQDEEPRDTNRFVERVREADSRDQQEPS